MNVMQMFCVCQSTIRNVQTNGALIQVKTDFSATNMCPTIFSCAFNNVLLHPITLCNSNTLQMPFQFSWVHYHLYKWIKSACLQSSIRKCLFNHKLISK